jgi:uncharacterized protein (TIGR00369 family)
MNEQIPEGFVPFKPASRFIENIANLSTFHWRESDRVLGVRIEQAHTNYFNIVHGGMLVTLADCALGEAISTAYPASAVTAQLSVEFLRPVRTGGWLVAHVLIDKLGRQLVNATCLLKVGDNTVLKANTVFCVLPNSAASHSDG